MKMQVKKAIFRESIQEATSSEAYSSPSLPATDRRGRTANGTRAKTKTKGRETYLLAVEILSIIHCCC